MPFYIIISNILEKMHIQILVVLHTIFILNLLITLTLGSEKQNLPTTEIIAKTVYIVM